MLVLTLVLLAGRAAGQEEVEFPSDYETTVDTEDIGDLSYDSEVGRGRPIYCNVSLSPHRIMT